MKRPKIRIAHMLLVPFLVATVGSAVFWYSMPAVSAEESKMSEPTSDLEKSVARLSKSLEASGRSVAAALAIGLAAFGGALGQGITAYAFLMGASRNPGSMGKFFPNTILILALIESLVIYGLIIAFMLMP